MRIGFAGLGNMGSRPHRARTAARGLISTATKATICTRYRANAPALRAVFGSGAGALLHGRRLADWSPRCRLRRATTATGSAAYEAAAVSPTASRTTSSHRGITPVTGARMSAAGRLACVAGGRVGGVGKTGADSVVTGTEALAALLASGTAVAGARVRPMRRGRHGRRCRAGSRRCRAGSRRCRRPGRYRGLGGPWRGRRGRACG